MRREKRAEQQRVRSGAVQGVRDRSCTPDLLTQLLHREKCRPLPATLRPRCAATRALSAAPARAEQREHRSLPLRTAAACRAATSPPETGYVGTTVVCERTKTRDTHFQATSMFMKEESKGVEHATYHSGAIRSARQRRVVLFRRPEAMAPHANVRPSSAAYYTAAAACSPSKRCAAAAGGSVGPARRRKPSPALCRAQDLGAGAAHGVQKTEARRRKRGAHRVERPVDAAGF